MDGRYRNRNQAVMLRTGIPQEAHLLGQRSKLDGHELKCIGMPKIKTHALQDMGGQEHLRFQQVFESVYTNCIRSGSNADETSLVKFDDHRRIVQIVDRLDLALGFNS